MSAQHSLATAKDRLTYLVGRERERAARLAVTREVKRAYFAVLAADAYAGALKDAVTAWEEVEREMNVR
jgi:outer membrane protein TolC